MDNIENIQNRIYVIRGQRIMLDRDLAALYGIETKVLNQSVKRNSRRFDGDDFMFRLTKDEARDVLLRSQIVTTENNDSQKVASLRSHIVTTNGRGGTRYLPFDI